MTDNKESKECVMYHDWMKMLGDMKGNNTTPSLSFSFEKTLSRYLLWRVERNHLIECVNEYEGYTGMRTS
jgi:hypothetical protein